MDISIIVPIYNSEKYLERCLNSIVLQNYEDFELILINDGSTDNSLKICNKYQNNYSRVNVVNLENNGVSFARNLGMKYARGEFILFVDSDDWLHENYIIDLINQIRNQGVDCVLQGFIRVDEDGSILKSIKLGNSKISSTEYEKLFFENDILFYLTPFAKIFRRSIIEDNNLKFNTRFTYGEDNIFCLEYLRYCNSIYLSDSANYFYTLDLNSLSSRLLKPLCYYEPYKYIEELFRNSFNLNYSSNKRIIQKLTVFITMFINSVFIHEKNNEELYLKRLEKNDWDVYKSSANSKSFFRRVIDLFLPNINISVPRFLINKFLAPYFKK
jgi:glycosyltransferase involved in cell wall biosynthesis